MGWADDVLDHGEFEGTVADAYFQESEFGVRLVWEVEVDGAGPDDDRRQVWLSVGRAGWRCPNGRNLEIAPGRRAKISPQSNFGQVLERVKKWGIEALMSARGNQFDAHVWIGLKFAFANESRTFKLDDGTERTSSRSFPQEFLGAVGDAKTTGIMSENIRSLPTAATTTSVPTPANGSTVQLREELVELAKGLSADEFLTKAANDPRVTDDEQLTDEVVSGEFYAKAISTPQNAS